MFLMIEENTQGMHQSELLREKEPIGEKERMRERIYFKELALMDL